MDPKNDSLVKIPLVKFIEKGVSPNFGFRPIDFSNNMKKVTFSSDSDKMSRSQSWSSITKLIVDQHLSKKTLLSNIAS